MQRSELEELQYIAHIGNLKSICEKGLLCHESASRFHHSNIANEEIISRRSRVHVPGGLRLIKYVNLYFCARNPMLFYLLRHDPPLVSECDICILKIAPSVIEMDDVIITDQNAAKDWVSFRKYPDGLAMVDYELMKSGSWNDIDPIEKERKKGKMCAEVLIPSRIDADFINAAYVSNGQAKQTIEELMIDMPVILKSQLFFH